MTYIYVLQEPITGVPRYPGKANDPPGRLRDHILEAKEGDRTRKSMWIRKLLREGLRPTQRILEAVSDDAWQQRERYWIRYFKKRGYDLLNHTEGGDGCDGFKHSEETMSKFLKERNSPTSTYKLGHPHDEDSLAALRFAAQQRNLDPEYHKKLTAANNRRWTDVEKRRKQGLLSKQRFEDPEYKQHMIAVHLGAKRSEESRHRMSESAKKRWASG